LGRLKELLGPRKKNSVHNSKGTVVGKKKKRAGPRCVFSPTASTARSWGGKKTKRKNLVAGETPKRKEEKSQTGHWISRDD